MGPDTLPPSVNLKSQYDVLAALKRIDDQLVRVLSDLAKLPQDKAAAAAALAAAKGAFDGAKTTFETTEKGARQAEMAVKEKDDFLKKAEAKLMEVKNNDEYRAALREMENHKKEKGTLEAGKLADMCIIEQDPLKVADSDLLNLNVDMTFVGGKTVYHRPGARA